MISKYFIERPIATTLITIGITLAGILAFKFLPVAPLPQVDFPTIQVSANLPGASPETMAATVATPLERALGRIAGITEMTSSSSLGKTSITLQFDLTRSIDGAASDVQAAINAARTLLPSGLPGNPTYKKVNPADAPIMILTLTSATMQRAELYDVASTILSQKLAQIKGVGQVTVAGSSLPAVRVDVDPNIMTRNQIGFADVAAAIAASNVNRPKGVIESSEKSWQILVNDQAKRADDYRTLIVTYRNRGPVRLSDFAEVTDSVEDLRNSGIANEKDAVLLIVLRQPNANIIETVARVRAAMPELKASMPGAIDVQIPMDRTQSIKGSLNEVEKTLLISVGLVVLVVFLFLGNLRATFIPFIVIPVSLIATFGVMYLLNFSLNNLSLMALTVATGFVVDDAIVVLETISRRIEQGESAMNAAILGAKEVGFTVLSISISLIAVFIPILLMGGIVGRLFKEFAITLSIAIIVSLFVSLTTTPMLCSKLLKQSTHETTSGFIVISKKFTDALLRIYEKTLTIAIQYRRITLIIFIATICLNWYLYSSIPKGFFPQQDTGRIVGAIQADQSISFQSMQKKMAQISGIVAKDPNVADVISFTGGGQRNTGNVFILLKPLSERKQNLDEVMSGLRKKLTQVSGATLLLQPSQDIRIGARSNSALYQFTIFSDNLQDLRLWAAKIRFAMMEMKELVDVNTDAQDKGIQTTLKIDRDAAAKLGLTMSLINNTLGNAFGQNQISTIYNPLNQYHVVLEVAPKYWQSPEILNDMFFSTTAPNPSTFAVGAAQSVSLASTPIVMNTGTAHPSAKVPLKAFASFEATNTPLVVNHQGQFAAATLSFNLPAGISLGDASDAVYQMFDRLRVPDNIRGGFQGTALAFQESLKTQPLLILAAIVCVYIVLGILYESLIHPITILSTLPSAGLGALIALMYFHTEFSVIALIGVLLLIGIVKKNAIMMIDYALVAQREQNLAPDEAIRKACLLRFRPITMTTVAAIMGAIPLAIGYGDGAEFRNPLGISIVGGLIVSQLLTLYTTPVIYLYMEKIRRWRFS